MPEPTHQPEGVWIPTGTVLPYPNNPRRGNVEVIAKSLVDHGQYKPIIVQRSTGHVLVGNHTLRAAQQLGWDTIWVAYADVDDVEAARIVLDDNHTSDDSTYDLGDLTGLLTSLPDLDQTSYDQSYVDDLLASLAPPPEPLNDPDDVPDVPVTEPATRVGDIWTLGPHRLICGDATKAATVQALMAGSQADCIWTDPPYGVDYVGKTKNALVIENDDLNEAGLTAFLGDLFDAALSVSAPGAPWYVAAPAGPITLAFASTLAARGLWRQTICWAKDQFVLGRSDYHWRHELLYYGFAPAGKGQGRLGRGGPHWYGGHTEDTVWEVARPRRSEAHPTMKPVALITRALENSTSKGQTVLDVCGGSGSTLIACHDTGRTARLVELDTRYCDVILRRFAEHTGITPTDQDGVAFTGAASYAPRVSSTR